MIDQQPPFEDPDFRHLPPTELMQQLAPLLVADGIDVDNLGDVDVDELKAALGRAIERHNMELGTPVADERARAINSLREIALALHHDQTALVEQLFASIEPDPTMHSPSSGHLIGVGMETLDAISADVNQRTMLQTVRLPTMDAPTKAAARDIQALASKVRAFRSIASLLRNHTGFNVTRAGAKLLSATVAAIAARRTVDFRAVLQELLPAQQTASQDYIREFQDWLYSSANLADDAPEIIEHFERLVADAQHVGIDLHQPDQFNAWVVSLRDPTDIFGMINALEIMHYYVRFRVSADADPAQWNKVIEGLNRVNRDAAAHSKFDETATADDHVEPTQRHRDIMAIPVVSGIFQLLDWLGTARPTTNTGMPRRGDIQTVAAMIGLDVQGVAKLPGHSPGRYVQSALSDPQLAAWWWMLQELEIITAPSTTARPGPNAKKFSSPDAMVLEDAERVIATYVRQVLVQNLEGSPRDVFAAGIAINRIMNPTQDKSGEQHIAVDEFNAQLIRELATEYLESLAAAGFVELTAAEPHVPAAVRMPVVRGLTMAMVQVTKMMDSASPS